MMSESTRLPLAGFNIKAIFGALQEDEHATYPLLRLQGLSTAEKRKMFVSVVYGMPHPDRP